MAAAGDGGARRARSRLRIAGRACLAGGLALVAAAAVVGLAAGPSMWGVVVSLAVVGALGLFAAGALAIYDRILHPLWSHEFSVARGLALVDAMPPGMIIERLLRRVYGDHPENDYIARALLGGAGYSADDGRLSVSTSASVRYELRTTTPGYYSLTSTVDFEFGAGVRDHTLVIFETCDPRLRDILVAGCDRPLFDWAFIPDREVFRDPLTSVDVGVRYLDADGNEHTTALRTVQPWWVEMENWARYLMFFRQAVGSVGQKDPKDYQGTLKIYEVDLADLAASEHPMHSVTGLTLRSATRQQDAGNCFWQPPFPCLLDYVEFDATGLETEHGTNGLEFSVQPFLPAAALVLQDKWVPVSALGRLPVGCWALPGHGIALLWRPYHDDDGRPDGRR